MRWELETEDDERDVRRARRAERMLQAKRAKARASREAEEKALLMRLWEKYGNPEEWEDVD